LILGIESSCDETAAAVVHGRTVLSNVIASQHDLHAEYRGVVPEIASRAHAERILPIIRRALADANVSLAEIDAVAVGHRPGLIGSLLVGVSAAKAAAWSLGKPLIGVDHLHAHLFAGGLSSSPDSLPAAHPFPALGLIVSGGHTSLYRLDSSTTLTRLGGTIDDAIGEAYDKAAAILGLPYPGGPIVDRLAQTGNDRAIDFPISRLSRDSLDFSFSGLKTAVLYTVHGVPTRDGPAPSIMSAPPRLEPQRVADICASFQRAAVAAVMLKLNRALDAHPDARSLLVGGGVSANSRLRTELAALAAKRGLTLSIPGMAYCLDNAAMIAGFGHALLESRGWIGDDLTLAAAASTFL
ncbi:MAG: tRNA (adenosine(37)-N6)-threonylcarbamoyltransferase complex transferase subunit TsaD, partial [Phycisphaerales bacterium]